VPHAATQTILAAHDGVSTGDVARLTGGAKEQILAVLKELEGSGKARRSGERRATRWHLADRMERDDYVELRTAELERLSA
jgi:hypothetical protein